MANRSGGGSGDLNIHRIPDKYLGYIMHFMLKFSNDTSEFNKPQLRKTFRSSYPLFLVLYGSLFVSSLIANVWMVLHFYREKRPRESLCAYLFANALNDIFKLLVVMPISLVTLFLHNWVLGSFLCFASPIVQDFPFYLTLLTLVAIACDRYRYAMNPLKRRIPPLLCLAGVCLVAGILTLPYAAYTKFIDLEQYLGHQFEGTGICAINLTDNIEEYIRGLFIVLYALPVALVLYLHVKVSVEIKTQTSESLALSATNRRESNGEEASVCSVASSMVPESVHSTRSATVFPVATRETARSKSSRASSTVCKESPEDAVDWSKERRTQNTVLMMVTVYAVCLLPLNILRLIVHVVHEGPEQSVHFDLSFAFAVLIAFLPTLATPYLFRVWYLSTRPAVDACQYRKLRRTSGTSSVGNKHRNNSRA
ncbi:prolactin-releasing peptide receptor [Ixodes scapularis]|uniref:prolactin-releasing peptide receptor n=1 Tax=Ixodes scapularis TaxID=6945 RepID=UPI0011616874|nr:prolactin-releasing peptide receptor [Ixodes scapularis]